MATRTRKRKITKMGSGNEQTTAMTVRDTDAPSLADAHTSKHQPTIAVISPGLAYNGSQNRKSFKGPDYNLHEVANALDKEPLFRRSVDKNRNKR